MIQFASVVPEWRRMIRDADRVEVRASEYLPADGTMYVLDPNEPLRLMPPLPLYVVCRPEDEIIVELFVARLRVGAA